MLFQLRQIILWPRDHKFKVRRIDFALGKLTVISGASRTGKSAVIPIIDYCLAAGSCAIPVNTIRQACEWFGIVIRTPSGEMLLARREPGNQRSTDDMFMMQAATIKDVPEQLQKNTNAPDVRRLLDELAGLTNLDFSDSDTTSGFDARPSFRDLSAFMFQPQNVIANPEVLFFKTDRFEHREKLRKIFPYILGAITPALLAKQHELRRLQSELRRKERELKDAQEVSQQWLAELRARFSEARELGLLNVDADKEPSRDDMLDQLTAVVQRTDVVLAISAVTISDAMRELSGLDKEESTVSFDLTALRRRLVEMLRIRDSASNYHEALRVQQDRLQISDWIAKHQAGDENCPVCGSGMEPSRAKLKELQDALVTMESEVGDIFQIPAAFDRELARVQSDVSETAEKLKAIQIRKTALAQRSREANTQQYQIKRVERFIGNLENALSLHRRLGDDGDLQNVVLTLRGQVKQLQNELDRERLDVRKRRALAIVNSNAARLMPLLDAERPNDPVSLEIDDLTVRVTGIQREDYLSEIGSGSNWLSYHIAIILALHQYFLAQKHSPVPGMVRAFIFDGPNVDNQARAAITLKNIAWVRDHKAGIYNLGNWGRRAVLDAARILPSDERTHWLKLCIANSPMILDRWIAQWVLETA